MRKHHEFDRPSSPAGNSGLDNSPAAESLAEYQQVKAAFDHEDAAQKYAIRKNTDTRRNRLELHAIASCMRQGRQQTARNCLDIPCGTFRLARLLLNGGLEVTAADYSGNMLDQARRHADTLGHDHQVKFSRQDIMATSFADQSFDLIICNRLFHHYSASTTRLRVLTEMRRLCRGSLVISYFDRLSLSNGLRRLKHITGYRRQRDRFAISRRLFREQARLAGFEVVYQRAIRRFISPQTYATLRPVEPLPASGRTSLAGSQPRPDSNAHPVILNNDLLIGSGLHRHCFQSPTQPDCCIKVVYHGNQDETRREQRYYRVLQRRGIPWTHLPAFHGTVATNLGQGAIFSLIRDTDGKASRSLQDYLDNPSLYPCWEQLDSMLQELKNYLLRHNIVTMTIKPQNILLQRRQGQPDRLVICDNIGCAEPIPLTRWLKSLAQRRTRRRFARFRNQLQPSLPLPR